MTEYRIKQIDDYVFIPQIKTLFGYVGFIRTEHHYAGCSDARVQFNTHQEAADYLANRETEIAKRKAEKQRKKTSYPKYFPWP